MLPCASPVRLSRSAPSLSPAAAVLSPPTSASLVEPRMIRLIASSFSASTRVHAAAISSSVTSIATCSARAAASAASSSVIASDVSSAPGREPGEPIREPPPCDEVATHTRSVRRVKTSR